MEQAATIGLTTAQDRASNPRCRIEIVETERGLAIEVDGNAIHSRRQDLLTFLTFDGAVNYVARHLATPAGLKQRLIVQLHAE